MESQLADNILGPVDSRGNRHGGRVGGGNNLGGVGEVIRQVEMNCGNCGAYDRDRCWCREFNDSAFPEEYCERWVDRQYF